MESFARRESDNSRVDIGFDTIKEADPFFRSCTRDMGRQMTYPDTSLTISLTNAVRLLKCPFVRDIRDDSRGVVFYSSKSVSSYALKLTKTTTKPHHGGQKDEREREHTWPLLRPTAIPLRCLTAMVMAGG